MLPGSSRPPSGHLLSGVGKPPTLSEILSNTSSPPWTLSAFMAYLSQNHCLETLEFTMEADRYRTEYNHIFLERDKRVRDEDEYMCSAWIKLMEAYIVPCAPREVNLPCPVRDRLLDQPCSSTPPHPSQLDEAVRIIYELMNDSVLVPFLESVGTNFTDYQPEDHSLDRRYSRARARSGKESSPTRRDASRSPILLPAVLGGRPDRSASNSTEGVDRVGLTDDNGSANSPTATETEPMTPPMTPPTPEWNFTSSSPPGGLQRALNAHNNGWKKVGAKLGLGKMIKPSLTKHQATSTTSSPTEGDIVIWEEPHPGQRYLGPSETTRPGPGERYVEAESHGALSGGEYRNGMTAKVYPDHRDQRYRIQRPFMVRKDIRIRRHPKAPARRLEACDIKADGPSSSSVNVTPLPEPVAERPPKISLDTDDTVTMTDVGTEVEIGTNSTDRTLIPAPTSSPCCAALNDVSNLLGIYTNDDDDRPAAPEPLPHISCDEDMYGWDAELDRRMSATENRRSAPGLHTLATSVRRGNEGARKLIHRVFSVGPTSASEPNTDRRNSVAD
ncbi:uncharacterized protein DNG_08470 [Cephalotrichum gorgonifer]|uniref:RGS domain-containing protein n=1 Tax=Cephalotrichum gorgonifer TaxID=2041049 RepID=A0AAE8N616_9PEZI|nr:uncharacterized protein DNG_08470 [Cephalotrichum gorgonifer]